MAIEPTPMMEEDASNLGLNSLDSALYSDDTNTTVALSNLKAEDAKTLTEQWESASTNFLEYSTGRSGEKYDPAKEEEFKNFVPAWMFERTMSDLQDQTFPDPNAFAAPILNKNVGDNPAPFANWDRHQNSERNAAYTERESSHHVDLFTGQIRENYPELDDDEYEMLAVATHLSEAGEIEFDSVVAGLDSYASAYAHAEGLTDDSIKSVFGHMKGGVVDREAKRQLDTDHWVEARKMAIQGINVEKSLGLKTILKDEGSMRKARVQRLARDHTFAIYGENINRAREVIQQLAAGIDEEGAVGETKNRSRMSWGLLDLSEKDMRQTVELVLEIAALESEKVDGSMSKMATNFQKAVGGSGEDIMTSSVKRGTTLKRRWNLLVPEKYEWDKTDAEVKAEKHRELMQTLRQARNTYRDSEAEGFWESVGSGITSNVHYFGMFAMPFGIGKSAMAMDMAAKADEQLRLEYPDMNPDLRWELSGTVGVLQMFTENIQMGWVTKGFPSVTRLIGGTGAKRTAGVLAARLLAANASEYGEEVVQSATKTLMHKVWHEIGVDIPDVNQKDWDENFWYWEDGDMIPFWDADIFTSLVGLSALGAGGRAVYEKFGAKEVKKQLADVDRLMLVGLPRSEAEAIAETNKVDQTKAFQQYQDAVNSKDKGERRGHMKEARLDGAATRVLEKDVALAEKAVKENGTQSEKDTFKYNSARLEYTNRFSAHMEEVEGGGFELIYPEADIRPTETYETRALAEEALLQHQQEVDESFTRETAEQIQAVEGVELAAEFIRGQHAKAGVKADIITNEDIRQLKEFASESAANMQLALDRVQHSLLDQGFSRPAEVGDFDNFVIQAEVKLREDARGYVERVAKGAKPNAVLEDAAEGFLGVQIAQGVVTKGWVKQQLFDYQKHTGDVRVEVKSPEEISDLRMKEVFSDLALGNAFNAAADGKFGKLSAFIRAFRHYVRGIMTAALNLQKLSKDGVIAPDFQILLDQSVGLNMDEQIKRQTVEAQEGILDELSQSITPQDATPSMSIGRTTITPTADTKVVEGSNATVVGEASFSIGAWHGTPHKVDKFKTENIGTGEGAQMYGYGLYFAEAKEVAEGYRINLAYDPDKQRINGRQINDEYSRYTRANATQVDYQIAEGLERLMMHSSPAEVIKMLEEQEYSKEAIDYFKESEYETFGGIYQVELNVEQEQLLDWGKPLSEQSDEVKSALYEYRLRGKDESSQLLKQLYPEVTTDLLGVFPESKGGQIYNTLAGESADVERLSKALLAAGIKGIKYLDGDSRNADFKISPPDETKAGDWMVKDNKKPFSDGVHFNTEAEAVAFAEEKSKGSYNYVMFDDADIKITEENGKAVSMDEIESVSMSIGSAQDAAYMEAVESGDVETQQRMVDEAARKAGYDSPKVYHGTKDEFDVFDKAESGKRGSTFGDGFYFTSKRKDAEKHGSNVISSYLKTEKIFNMDDATVEGSIEYGLADTSDDGEFVENISQAGYDSVYVSGGDKIADEFVVFSPNQIKSADPVTKDADGNVIPLSQRFDPSRDEISMSISPASDAVLMKINELARDPDTRLEIYRQMAVKVKQAQSAMVGEDDTTDAIVSNMKTIEAIISVLPMEIRYKAGRAAAMTKFSTVEQGMKYLVKRLDYVDTLLEEYLRKDLDSRVRRGIRASQPAAKYKASATGRSKIGDEARTVVGADGEIDFKYIGHRIGIAAAKAIIKNPQQAQAAAAEERAKIDENTTVAKQQEYEDVAYTYELFADIKNADSNRLTMMLDLLKTNWDEGRKGWRRELGMRKDWKVARKSAIIKGLLGKDYYESDAERARGKDLKSSWVANTARETTSIYHMLDFLREDMMGTPAAKFFKDMADDLRRASNKFDMEQINHRKMMKKAFSDIFQFKGTNKTARVQARIHDMSKGVEWGNKVTHSIMYDHEIKANKKQMEAAYDELAANEEQETVFLRDQEVTRAEFDEVYSEYLANFDIDVLEGFDKPSERKVFTHSVRRNTGKRETVGLMSQLDLLKDWLSVQQSDIKMRYEQSGYDEKYRSQLDDVLDEDTKRMGLWMQDILRQGTPATEALHRSEYGLAMATVMNYFPAVFQHKFSEKDSRLQIEGVDVAGVSKRPSSHMMRVNHKSSPERQNAVNTFNHHLMQNAYWMTHAEVLRKWGGILRDTQVQDVILRTKGRGFLSNLNSTFDNLEDQGAKVAQAQIESDVLWRNIGKGLSLGVLGLKISSTFKNALAGANVLYTRDWTDLAKTLTSGELIEAGKELYASDTFQRRLEMGASVATRYALQGSASSNIVFATSTRMAELGIQPINVFDTGTNLTMAMAYVAEKQSLRKTNPNMSEADIKVQALDYIDDMMARYAQPADRMSKSLMENTRPVLGKFLVLFQSEARKYLVINALAGRKLLTGKGVQSKKLAAQQMLVSNLVVTGGLHLIEAAFSSLFRNYGEGDDPEEKFLNEFFDGKKFLAALIADQLAGVPLFGGAWTMGVNKLMGEKVFTSTSNPMVRSIGGAATLLTSAAKMDENSASENADIILKSFQSFFAMMPQTAVIAQTSNVARDALGLLNNTFFQGLTEADTFDLYSKRLRKSASDVTARFKEEKDDAKESGDKMLLRQIDAEIKQEKIDRAYDILFELPEPKRVEYLQRQAEMEKPHIPKYMIRAFGSL